MSAERDRSRGICGETAKPIFDGPPLVCLLLAGHTGWHEAPQWGPDWYPTEPARWTVRGGTVSENDCTCAVGICDEGNGGCFYCNTVDPELPCPVNDEDDAP